MNPMRSKLGVIDLLKTEAYVEFLARVSAVLGYIWKGDDFFGCTPN